MPNKLTHHINDTQLEYILDELGALKDYRMQIICLLMPRGLRIQDTLNLTIEDIYDEDGSILNNLFIKEGKTGKRKMVSLKGAKLGAALNLHWNSLKYSNPESPIFTNNRGEQLTQYGVRYILHKLFDGKKGIRKKDFACHSFRKYGARKMYLEGGKNAIVVSKILNHINTDVTYAYIDFQPEEVRQATSVVDL